MENPFKNIQNIWNHPQKNDLTVATERSSVKTHETFLFVRAMISLFRQAPSSESTVSQAFPASLTIQQLCKFDQVGLCIMHVLSQ